MKKAVLLLLQLLLISACNSDARDFDREPHMSAVGSGLYFHDDQIPLGALKTNVLGPGMRLDENRINLFKDVKAVGIGDVVTIMISMDDRATPKSNQNGRSC